MSAKQSCLYPPQFPSPMCPWQMLAANNLEVLVSHCNNRYLLVVMDYFTKCSSFTRSNCCFNLSCHHQNLLFLDVLHSDQGRNFESQLLRDALTAFGIWKSHTTAYHTGWRHGWVIQLLPSALLHWNRKWLERIFATCIVCLLHSHTFLNQCLTFSTDVWQITSCYFLPSQTPTNARFRTY